MLNKIFNRQPRLEHPDPNERVLALADDGIDQSDVDRLLRTDPANEVRAAAAARCTVRPALLDAAIGDADAGVRAAAVRQLGSLLATGDGEPDALLSDARLPDDVRVETAKRAEQPARRKAAIDAIGDEAKLIALAIEAGHTETRMAAAERVHGEAALQQLLDGARNKDHGVTRLAKQRLDAMRSRSAQAAEADAILTALEGLASEPGPILTAVVELNRRWQAIDVAGAGAGNAERIARAERARQAIQARFDREQEQQRAKALHDRTVREWTTALAPMTLPSTPELIELRATLVTLREASLSRNDGPGLERLDEAERRITAWETEHTALAGAEALVDEAERLAADTSIDDAQLPARWQSLDRATRTPELTRRFEAALTTVETRRLAQVQATTQQASAAKQQLHGLLHAGEQSLTAGKLKEARAALDEVRTLKTAAGLLPKPTIQRLSRAIQQLSELERWESFGQQSARTQLIERAEALAAQPGDPGHLAQEVQKLRNEWKALDEQYKGVPKSLWERFDGAAEKAYAPAARHFAELAQARKDARKRREDYITQAAAHAPTLLEAGEAGPDWKAIDRWLRETDHGWHETALGSVDPGTWKKLEAKLKDAMKPARDALAAARDKVKTGREALIAEVNALLPRALDRDTPSQVKAIQQRWQDNARQVALAQRDERQLWEQFRSACDAVFTARQAKRSEEETRKSESRRALEGVAAELEQLARSKDTPDQDVRRAARDAQEKWKTLSAHSDPAVREVEPRFRRAKAAIDDALADRSRVRESAVWQTLDAKDRLCEALDRVIRDGGDMAQASARADDEWTRLAALPPAWEKGLHRRREDAKRVLADPGAADALKKSIDRTAGERRAVLLELELTLGLDSPKELQAERLALQVRQLKERFKTGTTTPETAGERYAQWCAMPGVVDATDRTRIERIVGALGSVRARTVAPAPPAEWTPRSGPSGDRGGPRSGPPRDRGQPPPRSRR